MAYRSEMTYDETMAHHSIEAWWTAETADMLHAYAEEIRALPPIPELGALTVNAAAELIGHIVKVFNTEAPLMDAGLALISGYEKWQKLRVGKVTA